MALHDKGTVRIELDDGDWIEIRRHVTVGARKAALDRATGGTFNQDGEIGGTFKTGEFRAGLLYGMIVTWSSPEPVNEQTIDELPEEVGDRVLEEIERLNPTLGADEASAPIAPLGGNSTSASESERDSGRPAPAPAGPPASLTSR